MYSYSNTPDIPYGYCHCGCGEKTKLSPQTEYKRGYVRGEPRKYLQGHWNRHPKGKQASAWKNGKRITNGYIQVYAPDHQFSRSKYVYEHRLVMESVLGRYLTKDEVVHHLNGNKRDNHPNNLQLMTRGEHTRIERTLSSEQWTKKHAYCIACGSTEWKHTGQGYCARCYYRFASKY